MLLVRINEDPIADWLAREFYFEIIHWLGDPELMRKLRQEIRACNARGRL